LLSWLVSRICCALELRVKLNLLTVDSVLSAGAIMAG